MKRKHQPNGAFGDPLSRREREILELLALHLTDHEIAQRLTIGLTTVKWYNRQIFNKLGVGKRQDAVEKAYTLGILTKPDENGLKHNLPAQVTPLVGRVREHQELTTLLQDQDVRLITLLSVGGMGKTRVALAVAQAMLPHFTDGIYFIQLAVLTSADYLVSTIADVFHFQFSPGGQTLKQQLFRFLHNKHMLLVLDNFEHLLEAAPIIIEMLQTGSKIKIVVTSREKLNLSGECVYALAGLRYPSQADEMHSLDYDAVQLFVQCAKRVQHHFVREELMLVSQICRLVEGMPLAIELAAAWIDMVSPAEIVTEISQNLDFLMTNLRDVPERLRSVRAVFESSWDRLTHEEQVAFGKLSVFQGGFTRDAAQEIANTDVITLSKLVNKALINRNPQGRYSIHELLRQYAAEQLKLMGQTRATQQAHIHYFAHFASTWGENLKGAQQVEGLRLIEADIDNIRSGFNRASDAADADLLGLYADIWLFFDMRGWCQEGVEVFGHAIRQLNNQENAAVGKLMGNRSVYLYRLRLSNEAFRDAQSSIRILRHCGMPQNTLVPLMIQGDLLNSIGKFDQSHAFHLEAHQLALEYGDAWATSASRYLLGVDAISNKDYDHAREVMEVTYSELKQRGDRWTLTFPLGDLATMAHLERDYPKAKQLYEELLLVAQENHFPMMIADSLEGLAMIAKVQEHLSEAKELLEKSIKIYRDQGILQPYPTIKLGSIVNEMMDYQTAKPYFCEAFETAKHFATLECLLDLGLAIAECIAQTSAKETAVELISLFQQHPQREMVILLDAERPDRLINQLKNVIPSDVFSTAWDRGGSSSLEMLLEKILY